MTDGANSLCVSRVPLFEGLTYEEQLKVAERARPVKLRRGDVIHRPGDNLSQLLVVHRGSVRVSHFTAGGQERLFRVLEPGDFIGEASFVTGARPDNWATVLADVELCSFDHAEFAGLVEQYPDIAVRMLHAMSERLEAAERLIADLTSAAVATRLARYLIELPTTRADGFPVVRLPYSKKDIASLLGTTPETLSRQLAAFSDAGIIAVQGRDIQVLDSTALEHAALESTGREHTAFETERLDA